MNSRRGRNAANVAAPLGSQGNSDDSDTPLATLIARNNQHAPTGPSSSTCVVCYEGKCTMVMDPCGHLYICKSCYEEIEKNEKKNHKKKMAEWQSLHDAVMNSDFDEIFDEPRPVYTIRCVGCNLPVSKAIFVYQN